MVVSAWLIEQDCSISRLRIRPDKVGKRNTIPAIDLLQNHPSGPEVGRDVTCSSGKLAKGSHVRCSCLLESNPILLRLSSNSTTLDGVNWVSCIRVIDIKGCRLQTKEHNHVPDEEEVVTDHMHMGDGEPEGIGSIPLVELGDHLLHVRVAGVGSNNHSSSLKARNEVGDDLVPVIGSPGRIDQSKVGMNGGSFHD